MARGDIRQPQSRIFSPQARRVASPKTQTTSASGTSTAQDFQRIFGAADQMAGQYARTKVQEQKEIDISDKHNYLRNKAKYVPQILKTIEEENLEGARAEKVMSRIQEMDEYGAIFSGFQDKDNLEAYQKDFLAEFEGKAVEWQTAYESQERGKLFAQATTSGLAAAGSPEERQALLKEFYLDAVDMEGPYKLRAEEAQGFFLQLAERYNQAGDYQKAKEVVAGIEWQDGLAADAEVLETTAGAQIEKLRLEEARKTIGKVSYAAHNNPNLTEGEARSIVEKARQDGVVTSGPEMERLYDFMMSGSGQANSMAVLMDVLASSEHRSYEGTLSLIDNIGDKLGISEKYRKMAMGQLSEQMFAQSFSRYQQAYEAYQANPNDPEAADVMRDAEAEYMKALKFRPLQMEKNLVDFANMTIGPDGEFDLKEIEAMGNQLDQVVQAFGGNLAEAVKTYFPRDNQKQLRARLTQLALMRDVSGGSWQQGFKRAVESRQAGPEAQHYTWEDQETYTNLMEKYQDKYGTENLGEFKTYLNSLKGAPLDQAFAAATQAIEQDYTTLVEVGDEDNVLNKLFGAVGIDAEFSSRKYKLKGKNGRTFVENFNAAVRERFGSWVREDGTTETSKQPFTLLSEYIEDEIPEWEEMFPTLEFENVESEDAFSEDGAVVVEAHPLNPNALILKHTSGHILAQQLPIDVILEAQEKRMREETPIYNSTPQRSSSPWR